MADIRPFCMPKWGIEMTEGSIAEWMVQEGQAFTRGQVLCLIETAKITNEVEAEYDLVLKRRLVPAGEALYAVGELLAVFAEPSATDAEVDAFIAAFKPAGNGVAAKAEREPAPAAASAPAASASAQAPAAAPKAIVTNRPISPEALKLAEAEGMDIEPIAGSGRAGRITYQDVVQAMRPKHALSLKGTAPLAEDIRTIFASPLARRLATQHGINLSGIAGTGPRGRISKKDVLVRVQTPAAAAAPSFGAPSVAVANDPIVQPFDKVRKIVARRVTEAKQTIPHFYLRVSVAVDELITLRKTANVVLGTKASINDYLVKAVALALVRHPDVNVQVHGDAVHSFPHADIAIAVASPKGLVTPVVRQADRLHIAQIAATTRALIDKAQAGRLSFEDLDGGTFSISNLGMYGIEDFDAIINPPQGAILAVGGINRVAVETQGADLAFESRIQLTLSVDHRAIDGAAGARLLQTLKGLIEAPESLFA